MTMIRNEKKTIITKQKLNNVKTRGTYFEFLFSFRNFINLYNSRKRYQKEVDKMITFSIILIILLVILTIILTAVGSTLIVFLDPIICILIIIGIIKIVKFIKDRSQR